MRKLNLNNLKRGLLGISEAAGAFMAEAAMVCLEKNGHESGIILKVSGEFEEEFSIVWSANITPTIEGTWKNRNETTEYGRSLTRRKQYVRPPRHPTCCLIKLENSSVKLKLKFKSHQTLTIRRIKKHLVFDIVE